MKIYAKLTLLAVLGASASTPTTAFDRKYGATSTSQSDISVTKKDLVQISGIEDLDLGAVSSTEIDLMVSDAICVYVSTAGYQMTATSGNGQFELQDSSGSNSIPYAVSWADSSASPTPVGYGRPLTNLLGEQVSTGNNNASFAVTVTALDFNNAALGSYTDVLILTISPE